MNLRHSNSRRGWWLLLLACAGSIIFFAGSVWIVAQSMFPWRPSGPEIEISVAAGQSAGSIGRYLQTVGVIKSPLVFRSYIAGRDLAGKFQAGTFRIPKNISLVDLVKILVDGEAEIVTVTIPEGWTAEEIATRLQANGVVEQKDFLQTLRQQKFSYSYAGYGTAWDSEGFLFPDTYQFRKGILAAEAIERLVQNFERRLGPELLQAIASQRRTLFDVVRLASIVEREVAHPEDRAVVAGIFLKRLEMGMALQSDATLNYATGNASRSLSAAELAIDSPYNTYKYRGLPPTPIGNPGLAAIRAVVYPQSSPYLYFLSGQDGKTHFAKTLAEQVENKRRYLN